MAIHSPNCQSTRNAVSRELFYPRDDNLFGASGFPVSYNHSTRYCQERTNLHPLYIPFDHFQLQSFIPTPEQDDKNQLIMTHDLSLRVANRYWQTFFRSSVLIIVTVFFTLSVPEF